jgi:phenylacetate-CoA ligase
MSDPVIEIIRKTGTLPRFLNYYQRQYLSKIELEKIKKRKLSKILSFSINNVPFYKRFYKISKREFSGFDINETNFFDKVPVITKENYRGNLRDFLARNVKTDDIRSTSGTSGKPLRIYQDKNLSSDKFFRYLRATIRLGYRPWKTAFGFYREPIKTEVGVLEKLGFFKGPILTADVPKEKIKSTIEKVKPKMIFSELSPLLHLCLSDLEIDVIPEFIIVNGGMLTKKRKKIIEDFFSCKVFNFYGCMEVGFIASECLEGSMHTNSDSILLEQNEELGCLITSFENFKMPLLRYRLGDSIEIVEDECSCGSNLPIIKSIKGRVDGFIVSQGKPISSLKILEILENFLPIDKFRLIQDKKGSIDFIVDKSVHEKNLKDAVGQLRKINLTKIKVRRKSIKFKQTKKIVTVKSKFNR